MADTPPPLDVSASSFGQLFGLLFLVNYCVLTHMVTICSISPWICL